MNNGFSCETVDGGGFAFAPLVGSNLFCQRTSQLGESACHMPISYRFILLETSAAGLPGNYLYLSCVREMLEPSFVSLQGMLGHGERTIKGPLAANTTSKVFISTPVFHGRLLYTAYMSEEGTVPKGLVRAEDVRRTFVRRPVLGSPV